MFRAVKNTKAICYLIAIILWSNISIAGGIEGMIINTKEGPVSKSEILIEETGQKVASDENGKFNLPNLPDGVYTVIVTHDGYQKSVQIITITQGRTPEVKIVLLPKNKALDEVVINLEKPVSRGKEISDAEISIGKNKLVIKQDAEKQTSTSLTRSIDAPVNIIEYDGAGLQLGIGGRGLNPKRTAHYNTRQNGYEISADALGYPETYYTPPAEAIAEISILRGAASLQYGPQFGGMINFQLKEGPSDSKDKFEFISNSRYGSYNQFHSFNSIATNKNKLKTYSFYHYKTGDGWRYNSAYNSHTGYTGLSFQASKKLNLKLQLTHHQYIAQQAGGLTDKQFEENPQQSFRERNWFNVNWNIASAIVHYKFNNDSWLNSKTFGVLASRNSVGFLENSTRIDDGRNRLLISGDFRNIGNETRWIKRYSIKEKNAALISGFRLYKGWAETAQALASDGKDADFSLSPSPEYSKYQFPSSNVSAFVENTIFFNKRFYLTPGYRFENINTNTEGYFNQYVVNNANDTLQTINKTNNSNRKRNIHLVGTGLTLNTGKNGKWIANLSKNFRSVNFSDINIVIPSFRVDPNIEDETGYTADITFSKGWNQKAFLSITGYCLQYSNRIGVIWQTDEEFNTFQYRTNVSSSRTLGIELTNWLNIGNIVSLKESAQKLNLMTNATFNNAKYTDKDAIVFGNWVEMVPALTLKSSLTYEYKNWLFSGLVNHQTKQFSEATNATESTTGLYGTIPSFYVVDTKIGYNFHKVSLQLSTNNITDKKYFTQRANSYPGPGIIPSEGRTYWASLIIKL